eukprot:6204871-Pleurochrysis_carterae.AAC.2
MNLISSTERLPKDPDESEPAQGPAASETTAVNSQGAAVLTAIAQPPSAQPAAAAQPSLGKSGNEGGVGADLHRVRASPLRLLVRSPLSLPLAQLEGTMTKAISHLRMRLCHSMPYSGKFIVASAIKLCIAFDDGDSRAFCVQAVTSSVEIGTIEKIADVPHALVDNAADEYKAEEITHFKKDRMVSPKILSNR